MSLDALDRAAGYATCRILESAGQGLVGVGVTTMWAKGAGFVPFTLGSLALLGHGLACGPSEVGEKPDPGQTEGCYKVSEGGWAQLQIRQASDREWEDLTDTRFQLNDEVTEIISVDVEYVGGLIPWETVVVYNTLSGQRTGRTDSNSQSAAVRKTFRLRPLSGTCGNTTGGIKPLPPEATEPIQYADEITNCNYKLTLQGLAELTEGGQQSPVWLIEAGDETARASGGVVGGCNFSPTIYVGGPGGTTGGGGGGLPPIPVPDPFPDPPGDGEDWWAPLVRGVAAGTASALVQQALDSLFKTKYPAGTREIYAACDYKEDGDPETFSVTFPEEDYQNRVLTALNAVVDFQQQILLWKTPTCGGSSDKPELFLHWRSITFESDDYTDTGNRRLVKRLRYRGSSPGDVRGLADHWKDFEWDTGGVIVYHKGSPVGTPQVWAASVDEGKRVLRHAFGEAGVDPDKTGEWGTSSSDHPRYGVPRRVKLKTIDGCWMATARQGPNGWPEAAVCFPSP